MKELDLVRNFGMKIFVFDTETTGFINKYEKDLKKQPHVIQFAWILSEISPLGGFSLIEEVNIMINPKVPIPYESSQVHHIYDIDVQNAPAIEEEIEKILYYINTPDIVIWHNIEFDQEMIKLELRRLWKEFEYHPQQTYCTMREGTNICKIEVTPWRFKFPKLSELHKHLFWEYFVGAHDALVDVKATLRCFEKMYSQKLIQIPVKQSQVQSLF